MNQVSESTVLLRQAQNAYQPQQGATQRMAASLAGKSPREVRKVAEDFEAVFLSQMLKPMFENIEAAEPFNGGPAAKMWKDMQVQEYGKAIARAGGVGIADQVFREMMKAQEAP